MCAKTTINMRLKNKNKAISEINCLTALVKARSHYAYYSNIFFYVIICIQF